MKNIILTVMLLGLLTGASFAQRGRAPMDTNRGMTQLGPYRTAIQSPEPQWFSPMQYSAGNGSAKCRTDAARDDVAKGCPHHNEPDYRGCHHRGNAEVRAKCYTAGCQADASHSAHQRPVAPPDAVFGLTSSTANCSNTREKKGLARASPFF